MLALHEDGRQIDPTLLGQRLRDAGQYESVGGAAFLLELSQEVATAAHAEYYARIVRDKAVLRSLIHASTDIIQEAYETGVDAREMLARAEERVFRILDTKGDTQVRPIRDVLHESLARIDARMQRQHAYGGLETGFIDYDELTGGLHDSELVILAARPSMGKTALALNIAEHIAIDERGPGKAGAARQPGNVGAGTGRSPALLARPRQQPSPAQRPAQRGRQPPADRKRRPTSAARRCSSTIRPAAT